MISEVVKRWVQTWAARLVRKVTIQGRSDVGYYSTDTYGVAPTDGEPSMTAQRYQLYGVTSEPPQGTEVILLAVNGGSSNRVAVAELPQNVPAIEADEVLIWAKAGQRVLLNKDGDVVVYPATGRNVILGSASGGDCDPVVTRGELNSVLSSLRTAFNGHLHPTPSGNSSAPTATIASLSVDASPNVYAKKP